MSKRIKSILSVLLCTLFLTMSVGCIGTTAIAASDHDCGQYTLTFPDVQKTTTYGTATRCYKVDHYFVTKCRFCQKELSRTYLRTDEYGHSGTYSFKYCDGVYLHYEMNCNHCGFLMGSKTELCTHHPNHPN